MGVVRIQSAAIVLAMVAGSTSAFGQTDAFWEQTFGSGNWSNGENWSTNPDFPDIQNGSFNAFISFGGKKDYTVVLDKNITINDFNITTGSAFLDMLQSTLTVQGNFIGGSASIGSSVGGGFGAGVLDVTGTTATSNIDIQGLDTVRFRGGSALSTGTSFANINMLDLGGEAIVTQTSFNNVESVLSTSSLRLTGTGQIDICDTCFDNGGTVTWDTTTDVALGGTSAFNVGPEASFNINAIGGGTFNGEGDFLQSFVNQGELLKGGDSSTVFFNDLRFINESKVRVQNGELSTNGVQLTFGGGDVDPAGKIGNTLSQGRWEVADGATLTIGEELEIFNLEAEVRLEGSESTFSAINSLGIINTGGRFEVVDGRDFQTQSNFSVFGGGTLVVGEGSTFTVNGELNNFGPGTFNQGEFDIQGTLIAQNAAVQVINNIVTLDGAASQILNAQGEDAFMFLNTIGEQGVLTLRNGRTIENIEALEVFGQLIIEGNPGRGLGPTGISVLGTYRQFSGATLLSGGFLEASSVAVSNTDIGGSGRIITSNLDLRDNSRLLINGPLEITGDVSIIANEGDPAPTIIADASLAGEGGVPSVMIAGALTMGTDTGAGFVPGGTLVLNFDKSSVGLGDEIRLIEAGLFNGAFTDIQGTQIGQFLSFEVFQDTTGVTLRVIPAPGTTGGLAILGLAAMRRRRAHV